MLLIVDRYPKSNSIQLKDKKTLLLLMFEEPNTESMLDCSSMTLD